MRSVTTPSEHFHRKGKLPTKHTRAVLEAARNALPFHDIRDFEECDRGLIARMQDNQIKADAGHDAWDMGKFDFIDAADSYDSIHPSLLRQAKLNQNYGLYEVIPGIYQIRGFDLSQMTFIRGKTGWIVFDVLISAETARAGLKLFREHVGGDLPIAAVVYSHNHVDHWGGIKGIVSEEDVRAGKVEIIAPEGFMDNTVAENVYAGNAMNRRAFFQYGILLPVDPYGFVTQGLGQGTSRGAVTLIAPTRIVSEAYEEFEVDGVPMVFQNTPDTEAPSEMNTWIPSMKALWMAENVTHCLHNIYTLRGAPVRDALKWSKYIAEALCRFGGEAEVMFAAHHWPRWGNARIQEVLRAQRDIYANLHNQVLHHANQGVTINQIHNVYEVPEALQQHWHVRGYHGSPEHNARGVIQRYLGYWDCNPATLIPPSPEDSAPIYVRIMGGAATILPEAEQLYAAGDFQMAIEILNKLVLAEPENQQARDLMADALEQVGYQQENPGLRNSFLAGAFELRSGIPSGAIPKTSSADVMRAMSTELFLNFLGIRLDSTKAAGHRYTMNLRTPDTGEQFIVELENATLTNIKGYQAENADLTLTIPRAALDETLIGAKPLEAQIADGTATFEGDSAILKTLAGMMVDFTPTFEVFPGAPVAQPAPVDHDPFDTGEMKDVVPE
ncbi:alkyl/aryl-sulfatase [Aliiruegeria lutimaris]|uniref:Alkyl sulfatase BDS1, metallo-beta-lactamase superfamily n=1 Tax=Aliiruegeria lutimaris TaxID=571298 RepID=A0A1G9AE77_9RHOB|nr:alkyl sulfatase dimerization domain-containing protein [Aliiruegeria lutimaris]SDK25553.1 Alkyl sulfatase BDS1, metallo-beta-lactamase superfamily [Aliiruegeria lutimaris]